MVLQEHVVPGPQKLERRYSDCDKSVLGKRRRVLSKQANVVFDVLQYVHQQHEILTGLIDMLDETDLVTISVFDVLARIGRVNARGT